MPHMISESNASIKATKDKLYSLVCSWRNSAFLYVRMNKYIKMWTDPELSVNVFSEVEDDFRERYSVYLRTMKQRIYDTCLGFNELEDERKMVNQQVIRTPGRRGEIIKNEEIDKEFSRRYIEYKKIVNYSD